MERYKKMSKELEALNKLQHDFGQLKGQELVSCYETIFNALKRLEAIDNANPSEALEILEEISKEEVLFKNRNTIYMGGEKSNSFTHKDTIGNYFKGIEDIKQSLLKAQEPKQYLKWEDLDFKEKTSQIEVKLNKTLYTLSYVKRQYLDFVYLINNDSQIRLNSANDKQFFNDLHLERVEE